MSNILISLRKRMRDALVISAAIVSCDGALASDLREDHVCRKVNSETIEDISEILLPYKDIIEDASYCNFSRCSINIHSEGSIILSINADEGGMEYCHKYSRILNEFGGEGCRGHFIVNSIDIKKDGDRDKSFIYLVEMEGIDKDPNLCVEDYGMASFEGNNEYRFDQFITRGRLIGVQIFTQKSDR